MFAKHYLKQHRDLQEGGAALEYVIISVFGLALSIAAVAYVRQAVERQFADFSQETGIEFDSSALGSFGGGGG